MNLMDHYIKKNIIIESDDANMKKVETFAKKSKVFGDPQFVDDDSPKYYALKNSGPKAQLTLADIKLISKLTFVKTVTINDHWLYLYI